MIEKKISLNLNKLTKAVKALEEMAAEPYHTNRMNIDATIQRFEFTVELFWKFLKSVLESMGIETQYPKEVLIKAYQGKLISDEQKWLAMLKDRNLLSHTYEEQLADEIYERIKAYIPLFKSDLNNIVLKLNFMDD